MYCYLNYIYVEHFFGAGVLGPPVWEPGPNILGGHAGAPKTYLQVPLPTIILEAPVKMLLHGIIRAKFSACRGGNFDAALSLLALKISSCH
jgi:hypothetical protein